MTLERYLADLGDEGQPLRHAALIQLSGLSSDQLVEFKMTWPSISRSRKSDMLRALSYLGEDNLELDFSAVFRACLDDEEDEVRERAARSLWDCDDRAIIRPLIALLNRDPAPTVRAAAATSLGKFAGLAQEGKLLRRDGERVRTALLAVIDKLDEEPEARRRAIEAVASFDSPEIEGIIRDAYQSDDPKLKQSAIYAMGRSSNSQWLPIVLQQTQHEEPAIRYEAAIACGQLGDEQTVPYLLRLVSDEDAQVQLSAVQGLGAIGGPLAKSALLQCLRSGDEALEEAAQTALNALEFDDDPLGSRFQG